MSTIKKYQIQEKLDNGEILILYPQTSADIVDETTNKKIMTQAERTKLQGIEEGAQVNILEGIQVNGVTQPITNKVANITIELPTDEYIPIAQKGVAQGVATLDNNAKIPVGQLPDAVLGNVLYGGSFIPNTGVATVTASFTSKYGITSFTLTASNAMAYEGVFFIASENGTFNNVDYNTGDWSISNGSAWSKVDNVDAVVSVNGKVGAVVLTGVDINTTDGTVEERFVSDEQTIQNILDGIVSVGKARSLATARTIGLSGDITGSGTFDGAANLTINSSLSNTGVRAATYSAVSVDVKGRVTAGGNIIEIATSPNSTPSESLVIGGLFFKEI